MDVETSWRVLLVKMFEHGHSFDDLRNMNIEDLGLVVGYWHEKGRIEAKKRRIQKRKKGKKQ